MTTQVDARRHSMTAERGLNLLKDVDRLVVAKSKRVVEVDLKRDPPPRAELLKLLSGPTGNLRAPTLRKGRTLVVGFDEDTYRTLF